MEAGPMEFFKIFEGNITFKIPIYQRQYSWSTKHCKRMFDDILQVGKDVNSKSHFFGSIVYLASQHHNATVQEMIVIDGQQRLTSFMLLLYSFYKAIKNKKLDIDISADEIANIYLANGYRQTEEEKQKLVPTDTDADTFKMILDGGDTDNLIDPSENILRNFTYFEKRVKALEDNLEPLWNGIKKLKHIDISLTEGLDNPQVIFDSLNSTGKELNEADKIRNLLLMGLDFEEQIDLYKKFWLPMEKRILEKNDNDFDEFVKVFLTAKLGRPPNSSEIYSKYQEYFWDKNRNNKECIIELEYFSKIFATIALENHEDDQIKEALWFNNKLRNSVSYPLLLQIFSDFEKKVILKEDVLEIIELCQSYIFRRIICGQLTSGHRDFFAKLYDRIDKANRQKYVESIKAEFQVKKGKYRFPTDTEFHEHLLIENMYERRPNDYPLLKLENFLRKKEKVGILDRPKVTIEHILPQNPNLSKDWQNELGENWKEKQNIHVHRLGNLTLTELNSEYSDRSFKEKKEKGLDNSIYKLSTDLKHTEHWNVDEIENRTKNLSNLALDTWKHPKLQTEIMKQYEDEDEENKDTDLEDTWEKIRQSATPEAIKLQDKFIEQVTKKFVLTPDQIAPDSTALKFYTKDGEQYKDCFLVLSGRKTICRICYRIDPQKYESPQALDIKPVKGYWFRHSHKKTGNEVRVRVTEDNISLILNELEHAYNTTQNYSNYE